MKFKDLKKVLKGSALLRIEETYYFGAYWEDGKVCDVENYGKWEDDYIYDDYEVDSIRYSYVHEIIVDIYDKSFKEEEK